MRRKRTVRKGRASRTVEHFGRSLKPAGLARGWQSSFSKLVPMGVGAISTTQRQAGRTLELMGRSTQAKVGLLQQAVRAAQDPNPFASQAKWVGFWRSAVGLAQVNTATLLEIHSRAISSWLRLVTKHSLAIRQSRNHSL